MVKLLLKALVKLCYRVEIKGLDHYHQAGKRVVIVANHLSLLDPLLIALFLPEIPFFVINSHIANVWYLKPWLRWVAHCTLDPTNPLATRAVIQAMRQDRKCLIFPEGRITVTGSLMKVYEGPGLIADKSDAVYLPIRIYGAQYTPFSRLKGKVRIRWFPKITLTVLAPRRFKVDAALKGRHRRVALGMHLYDVMSQMLFDSANRHQTLFASLTDQVFIHGRGHTIIEDAARQPLSYGQFLSRCTVLGASLVKPVRSQVFIGLLLPNSISAMVAFFGLQAYGRVPVMLNFSMGAKALLSACQTAAIKTVYTSKRFVAASQLTDSINALTEAGVQVCYLETVAGQIAWSSKWRGLLGRYASRLSTLTLKRSVEDAAVVLFTSGSEGAPKAVVLSHGNLQANRYQLASRIDFGPTDIVFNALPIFHSFGLTGGALLPLLSGIRTFFYPSPLHYRIVPELVYDTNATIMFGTDTFLSGYARFANNYDFYSLRYVFAGAEKLKESTRSMWSNQYGVRIFEGYGATETSPALSINTPMYHQSGTVGRFLPGVQYKLAQVPGIEDGGRLIVTGPNVMQGYMLATQPGVLVPTKHQTYDTGDIVSIDASGFITIQGRMKRFAKIAGEMVSLTAVEASITANWPEHLHAVIAVPDEKKGEALLLMTECADITRAALNAYANAQGIAALSVPKQIKCMKLPLLGTGKIDYMALKECNV